MKNKNIYNKWSEFINDNKYFLNNEIEWNSKFNSLKEYIDNNNKKPSRNDTNNKIKKLECWIQTQQRNYKNKKE